MDPTDNYGRESVDPGQLSQGGSGSSVPGNAVYYGNNVALLT